MKKIKNAIREKRYTKSIYGFITLICIVIILLIIFDFKIIYNYIFIFIIVFSLIGFGIYYEKVVTPNYYNITMKGIHLFFSKSILNKENEKVIKWNNIEKVRLNNDYSVTIIKKTGDIILTYILDENFIKQILNKFNEIKTEN